MVVKLFYEQASFICLSILPVQNKPLTLFVMDVDYSALDY